MLASILNIKGVQELSKKTQAQTKGGGWPTNKEDCELCGGEWGGIGGSETFGLCLLSEDSPCA